MKTLAFALGLCIATVGAIGILVPSELVWIAEHSGSATVFFITAAVRIAFGFVLISAAPSSRAPMVIRILGYVILVAGIVTALTALSGAGMDRARAIINWWLQFGPGVFRLTSAVLLAIGGGVVYAFAPRHDTA